VRGPFALCPEMSRAEWWVLVAGAVLFWANLAMPAWPDDHYKTHYSWVADSLSNLPGSFMHQFEPLFTGMDIDTIRNYAAVFFIRYGVTFSILVLAFASGLLVLRPRWRAWAWDAVGIVCLTSIFFAYYSMLNTEAYMHEFWFSAPHLAHFLLMLGYYFLAALVFGHFGRLLFRSRRGGGAPGGKI